MVAVSTDISNWWAFVSYFFLIILVTQIAQLPFILVAKRSLIEVPFIFFAILMPFFGSGERFIVGPFDLYRDGLLASVS